MSRDRKTLIPEEFCGELDEKGAA